MENTYYDVIIIGGGIIGFSTAFQLLKHDKTLRVAVLEKEPELGLHQTGRNSGVIHAGVYYQPGSLKAQFCLEGCRDIKAFCTEHRIPFKVPGKLITATNQQELIWMQALIERCTQNSLTVEKLSISDTQKMQPGLRTAGAFFVKETGIVNWRQVCKKYAELFEQQGGRIFYEEKVVSITESARDIVTRTNKNVYTSGYLITCAGLYADRLVKMNGLNADFKIVPFRGEYFRLSPAYDEYIKHLIYPVPNPALPFLGVHFTPQITNYVTVGPTAVLAFAREGYTWKKINIKDCAEICTYWPAWKLILKNFSNTIDEFRSSVFKRHYLKTVQKYFPNIKRPDFSRYPAGVRAQAVDKTGKFIQDFLFVESNRSLHTCNAPSPAATSSLPIGRYIVTQFVRKFSQTRCLPSEKQTK